ncbi:hypothetical protein [Streptomyces sp.]|uniref:hypothetical protein n=1 Tax=Streptomyces sp. TaxID=1931 RepID=UPI002812670F|nr:hypothetical protein [Streptomyces sp.]
MKITARRPLSGNSTTTAWGRVIGGRRYWFEATPFEIKVFRLDQKSGSLVHHWRHMPDTVGEYDRYDPATRPRPGEIAWAKHWDHKTTELLYVTGCRVCGDVAEVTRQQLIARHGDPYGTGGCAGTGTAATLEAALVRDSQLSPMEKIVSSRLFHYLISCRGFDSITGEECHHPICDSSRQAGMAWTLSGWRKVEEPALF